MPTQLTKDRALRALDGMAEIVRREMLISGTYVEDEVSRPDLAAKGTICGGRKHCAIGSFLVGGGVKPVIETLGWGTYVELPGSKEDERAAFFRHRPGLRLGYDALNQAARAFAERNGFEIEWTFGSDLEGLFEHNWKRGRLTKRDLLKVIAAARRIVKAA